MIFQVLRFSLDYNISSGMAVTLALCVYTYHGILPGTELWLKKAQASLSLTSGGFHWTTSSPL